MTIASIIIFLAATVGLVHVVTESKIGTPIRAIGLMLGPIGYLVTCPPCFGFWAALCLVALGAGPTGINALGIAVPGIDIFAFGLAGIGINRILFGLTSEGE